MPKLSSLKAVPAARRPIVAATAGYQHDNEVRFRAQVGEALNAVNARLDQIISEMASGTVRKYVAVSSAYLVNPLDDIIDCVSGTFTVSLPTAAGRAGRVYTVKNSGAGTITVDAFGAQVIDGQLSVVLAQYAVVTVCSSGSDWIKI